MSQNIFSDTLSSLLSGVSERPMARLYFNLNCPLIQKLLSLKDDSVLWGISRILYIQAMLVGGQPLHNNELQIMNKELLNLVGCPASRNNK